MASVMSSATQTMSSPVSSPLSTSVSPTGSVISPGEFVPTRRKKTKPTHRKISPFTTNEEGAEISSSWFEGDPIVKDAAPNMTTIANKMPSPVTVADIHPKPRSAKKISDVQFTNRSPTDAINNNTSYRNKNTSPEHKVVRGLWTTELDDTIEVIPDAVEKEVPEPVPVTESVKKASGKARKKGLKKHKWRKGKRSQPKRSTLEKNEERAAVDNITEVLTELHVQKEETISVVKEQLNPVIGSIIPMGPSTDSLSKMFVTNKVSLNSLDSSTTPKVTPSKHDKVMEESVPRKDLQSETPKKSTSRQMQATPKASAQKKADSSVQTKVVASTTPSRSSPRVSRKNKLNLTAEELAILSMFNEVDASDLSQSMNVSLKNSVSKSPRTGVKKKNMQEVSPTSLSSNKELNGTPNKEVTISGASDVAREKKPSRVPVIAEMEPLTKNKMKKKREKKNKQKTNEQEGVEELLPTLEKPKSRKQRKRVAKLDETSPVRDEDKKSDVKVEDHEKKVAEVPSKAPKKLEIQEKNIIIKVPPKTHEKTKKKKVPTATLR